MNQNLIILLSILGVCVAFPSPKTEIKPKYFPVQNHTIDWDKLPSKVRSVLDSTRSLGYIGAVGQKHFYYGTPAATQAEASTECRNNGLKLAEFSSQSEVDIIAYMIPEDFCWTGAQMYNFYTSNFYWMDSSNLLPNNLQMEIRDVIGLTLSVYTTYGKLASNFPTGNRCFICYQNF